MSEVPSPSDDTILPLPLHTVYVYTVHVYLFTQGTGGEGEGGELTREKVRGTIVHKAGRKYQDD
jgi:hypothetical protein